MSGEKNNLRQDEGALRILEALSAVDEELLERSGAPVAEMSNQYTGQKVTDVSSRRKLRNSLWQYRHIWAACFALVVVGALSWNGLRVIWRGAGAADSTASGGSNQMTGGSSTGATAVNDSDGASMNQSTEGMDTGASVMESYEEAALEPDSEEGRTGGSQRTEDSSSLESDTSVEISCPPDNRREITEKEARATEILGNYLPTELPAGYAFESARMDDQGQLYLLWCHGMDTISISVTFEAVEELTTVDVSLPETYDVRLYEIPYGETVPREYWSFFDNPVFAAEDLSLEVVSSRMKTYEDAGDTDTPRGNFSVLYAEGILVRFNGRGTAQEIWNMFSSLPQ